MNKLSDLRAKAEACPKMNLTQSGEIFESAEWEYLVAVSNPSTVLALLDTIEDFKKALIDIERGLGIQDYATCFPRVETDTERHMLEWLYHLSNHAKDALAKLKERWSE